MSPALLEVDALRPGPCGWDVADDDRTDGARFGADVKVDGRETGPKAGLTVLTAGGGLTSVDGFGAGLTSGFAAGPRPQRRPTNDFAVDIKLPLTGPAVEIGRAHV